MLIFLAGFTGDTTIWREGWETTWQQRWTKIWRKIRPSWQKCRPWQYRDKSRYGWYHGFVWMSTSKYVWMDLESWCRFFKTPKLCDHLLFFGYVLIISLWISFLCADQIRDKSIVNSGHGAISDAKPNARENGSHSNSHSKGEIELVWFLLHPRHFSYDQDVSNYVTRHLNQLISAQV